MRPLMPSFTVPSPPTATTSGQPSFTARRARLDATPGPVVSATPIVSPARAISSRIVGHRVPVRLFPARGLTTTNARVTTREYHECYVHVHRLLRHGPVL